VRAIGSMLPVLGTISTGAGYGGVSMAHTYGALPANFSATPFTNITLPRVKLTKAWSDQRMPETVIDERFDRDGNVIERVERQRPARVVDDAAMQQAKQTLRQMWANFMQDGQPTGTPSAIQLRNWCLALTAAVRYLANETDDESA
jgi:hypothetical protein